MNDASATPTSTPLAMASPAETAETMIGIVVMLASVRDSLTRTAQAGPLNAEQRTRLDVAVFTIAGLQNLFAEEAARLCL